MCQEQPPDQKNNQPMTELLDTPLLEDNSNHLSRDPLVRRWLIFYCLFCVGATTVAAYEVESIIGSGPLGVILALIIKVMGGKYQSVNLICWSMFALVLGCALLIEIGNWSPLDARLPIPIIMGVYSAGILVTILKLISRR